MYINSELQEILYVNKQKYKNLGILTISIYLISYMLFSMFIESGVIILDVLTRIFYLVSSFSCIILIFSTSKIFKSKIFMILSVHYIIVLFMNIYFITNVLETSLYKFNTSKLVYDYISIYFLMLSIIMVYKYIENINYNYKWTIFKLSVAIFILLCIQYFENRTCFIAFNVMLVIINLINVMKIYKNSYNLKNNINYLKIYSTLNFLISIFLLIAYINKSFILTQIIRLIFFPNFCLLIFFTVDNILNTPYKILFSKLYKSNKNLNKMNNELLIKNEELELSHKLIRKKELMFKDFFRSIPIPIVILSNVTQRIIYCNRAFFNLIDEENIKKVINKKIINLVSSRELEEDISKETDKIIYSGYLYKNGTKRNINIKIIDRDYEDGEIILSITDITSQVNMSSIKYEFEKKLFQEGLKRDFLSNISHDLKTPINVIYSALQLEDIFIDENDRQALVKYNKISRSNCFSLMKIANNLIDISKIQSDYLIPNKEKINIVEFIEDTISGLICYANEKNIGIIFDTNNEEVYLNLDEGFMQRIILNLISNSIKFTKNNGRIDVMVLDSSNYVKFIVKDNGIGMDEAFIDKIFNKYSMEENNNKANENGSGIGLFVVKNLVELQDGHINIKSKKKSGTEVIITFRKGELSD